MAEFRLKGLFNLAVLTPYRLAVVGFIYIDRKTVIPAGTEVAAGVGQDVALGSINIYHAYLFATFGNKDIAMGCHMDITGSVYLNYESSRQEFVAFMASAEADDLDCRTAPGASAFNSMKIAIALWATVLLG